MSLHRNSVRVIEAAAQRGLQIQVTRFPSTGPNPPTRTAADAAAAIGCEVAAIAKSIVLGSDAGPVLVLTSGANRVDPDKVERALGVFGVRRADAEQARAATGFPIGGTAPFGHPAAIPTLLDADLLEHREVWAAAGTPDSVFPIAPRTLAEAAGATIADVALR